MNEFLCIFRFQVHGTFASASSNDVWLEKRVFLPFPPQAGIEYRLGDWEAVPTEIVYEIDKETFLCYVESDKEIYNAIARELKAGVTIFEAQRRAEIELGERTLEVIVSEYLAQGWERDKHDDC